MSNSKALQSKSNLVDQINKFFNKDVVNDLSKTTKFVQRASRLTGMDFLQLNIFAHQQMDEMSLEGLSRELLKEGKTIAKQSLQERYNERAVVFMQKMVSYALSVKLNTQSIIKHNVFGRIIIGDATSYQLPAEFSEKYKGFGGGASVSAIKIQYNYDLLSAETIMMLAQSGTNPDTKQGLGELKKTTYE